MGSLLKTVATLTAALALASPAAAATQLFASSYSMPNGDGTAHGGSFNYWDINYTGAGAKTTDGAALSGGLGDLTDGVVATDFWFNTESTAGTGPYVGWYGASGTRAPTITFNFAAPVSIDTIRIHLDNSGSGGVFSPEKILVDGVERSFVGLASGTIGSVDLTGLGLSGASHTVQFIQAFDQNAWVFTSEVSFFGAAGVAPEPGAWALMIGGFALAGGMLRRRASRAI